jgi:hypothetical protein
MVILNNKLPPLYIVVVVITTAKKEKTKLKEQWILVIPTLVSYQLVVP